MNDKILIANRGEIAIRIMQACRDLGIDYVVVYTAADADSEHVRQNLDSRGNSKKAWQITSYTDPNDILAVADHTDCTVIHPGYGFFSEDFRFARRVTVRDRPLTFIGPNWQVIKNLGDKINTKKVAKSLEIPVISTDVGGVSEMMEAGKCGLLTENQNVEEMAEAMLRLAVDPIYREEIGRRGREFVERRFSEASMLQATSDLYVSAFRELQRST